MSSCSALNGIEPSTTHPASPRIFSALLIPCNGAWVWFAVLSKRAAHGALAAISSAWALMTCKALIGGVAAFDTYLTIKYAESLDIYEQNPLGRWMMGLDQGPVCETQQIAAFITAKFVGTLLVIMAIQGLAYWRMRVAGLVATPVALAQLYLVLHLVFGDG